MRTPTSPPVIASVREALAQSVIKAWDQEFSRPTHDGVDGRQARIAVADVVDALRSNPAWATALGIRT